LLGGLLRQCRSVDRERRNKKEVAALTTFPRLTLNRKAIAQRRPGKISGSGRLRGARPTCQSLGAGLAVLKLAIAKLGGSEWRRVSRASSVLSTAACRALVCSAQNLNAAVSHRAGQCKQQPSVGFRAERRYRSKALPPCTCGAYVRFYPL
jgi:hypothetical protein